MKQYPFAYAFNVNVENCAFLLIMFAGHCFIIDYQFCVGEYVTMGPFSVRMVFYSKT